MLSFFVYVSLFTFTSCSRFHVGFVPRGRFSLHSIVYDIQVTYKQASDISDSHVSFKMINPTNVVKIFADRASNLLPSIVSNNKIVSTTITNRECDVAPFICCSWCDKPLCFNHFFLNYHFHWFTLVRTFLVYHDTRCEMKSSGCFIVRWTANRSGTDNMWSNS